MKYLKNTFQSTGINIKIFTLILMLSLPLSACAKSIENNKQNPKQSQAESNTTKNTPETLKNNSIFQVVAPETVYAGEPFLVNLTVPNTLKNIKITWGNKSFNPQFKEENGQLTTDLLLSIPLQTKDATRSVTLSATQDAKKLQHTVNFNIAQRQYPEQRLTVSKKFVNPNKAEQERIKKESKIINAALAGVSPTRYWDLPLSRPIPYIKTEEDTIGRVSSVYGLRRFFNNQEKAPHKGVDLSAPKNENILACMDGKVVLVGDFFYSGRCVFVDHGQGVFTYYLHMTEPLVKEGDMVKRGDTLGLVGSTGRSTGPHLHLGFTVLGETVNPAPFMPDL